MSSLGAYEIFRSNENIKLTLMASGSEVDIAVSAAKKLAEKKDIHHKILNTTDNTYNSEYGYVGEANKQKGTARRLD